jgi:hypothetical protein
MLRILLSTIMLSLSFSSCQNIDEDIIPVVGIYRAHVLGVAGPFDLIIGTDGGDNVIIEAPFDGIDWYTIIADIDNQNESIMDININNQEISAGTKMKGSGFFKNGTIELKYTITVEGKRSDYTIVGTKF